MEFLKSYKTYFILGGIVGFIIIIFMSYINLEKEETIDLYAHTEVIVDKTFFVDVKGAVKKPGVYSFVQGDRVIDAIKQAGGLAKNANTSNINLSQRLQSEMVVYVYTSSEIKNGSNNLNCSTVCETNVVSINNCYESETSNKININTASLEELMTLSGLGEAKAKAIIEYRQINGLFNDIQDLTKVSGIGESTFNNLKEHITV